MAERLEYPFGTIHVETAGRWLHMDPVEDRAVWMLNLMKYREVAEYDDGGGEAISGRQADDIYAPTEILADLGAMVPLFGDVVGQATDGVAWDRIGIVRYPSRRSFFAMQERGDFKEKYVHKKAGMESTIVMGCLPGTVADPARAGSGPLVMRVRRLSEEVLVADDPSGVVPVAHFVADGVIVGDGREWTDVRFDRLDGIEMDALVGMAGVEDEVVVLVDPLIEELISSVTTADG